MKRAGFAAVVLLCFAAAPLIAQSSKKPDSRIKLQTKDVAVVDVQSSASKCADPKKGITVTFKITNASPVDVRLWVTGNQFAGVAKDFPDRKPGSEFSDYMCLAYPRYEVYTRPAGSNQPWPKK